MENTSLLNKNISSNNLHPHIIGMNRLLSSGLLLNRMKYSRGSRLLFEEYSYINFASGAYLDLNHSISILDYLRLKREGIRSPFSRISGISKYAYQLETKLKNIFKKNIYTAQSISLINMNIFLTLSQVFKEVVIDSDAHSTLYNGAKLSKMNISRFKHNSLVDLEIKLKGCEKALIVIDGLYSMKGDIPKLKEISILAKKYNAYILIDDAHGFGVLGKNGYGVLEQFNKLADDNIIYIGSFSKACSNSVGFVAVNDKLKKLFDSSFNASIFSGPPCNLNFILSLKHLNRFESKKIKNKRNKIRNNIKIFHSSLKNLGVKFFGSEDSPIVGVRIKPDYFEEIVKMLIKNNIYVKPAIAPVVRSGSELLRFTFTSAHTESDIEVILNAIKKHLQYFLLEQ